MSAPASTRQVEFLVKLQQLLAEGQFTASYKFALLLALADLSVELGDDSGQTLRVPVERIAEKFIGYYWRQAAPYVSVESRATARVLQQNTGRQAEIVTLLDQARARLGPKVQALRGSPAQWAWAKSTVARVIKVMPLWKLQTVRGQTVEFLYSEGLVGGAIELRPGVAYCFRRFHGLIEDLVQAAWLRFVRGLAANQRVLGQATDLAESMFGSERTNLAEYATVLRDVDGDECFYCQRAIQGPAEVDHFIPWSRYPVDLGHNFVLAHKACNASKGDLSAAAPHLRRWWERAATKGTLLARGFDAKLLVHDVAASREITRWAYEGGAVMGSRVWQNGNALEGLDGRWRPW